ncbi:ENDOG [Mytilus coruscus]|uniref:Endonuclease n=1 Tax=Mytilus coruscus TaxID=42192 RepID=A0A6J8E8G2_MYTCO|nr:ENDOG [Mytilus coruscus]
MKFGFPSLDQVRSFDNFVLSYDRRNRNAQWVFEHIKPEHVMKNENIKRGKSEFMEDNTIHKFFRATNSDFKNSGYDRGHLAAAANHRHTQKAMDQTFTLSNISPQVGNGFNRDAWNDLEKYVRAKARQNRNVYCCTGPLYLPRQLPSLGGHIKECLDSCRYYMFMHTNKQLTTRKRWQSVCEV